MWSTLVQTCVLWAVRTHYEWYWEPGHRSPWTRVVVNPAVGVIPEYGSPAHASVYFISLSNRCCMRDTDLPESTV